MTKQRLSKYITLKMENANQLERLARMESEAQLPGMRESDGSQHTGGATDRMEKAIIRYMEYRERITPKIKENEAEMERIEEAIDRVGDPMEREVLRLRYTDGEHCRHMPWRDVALKIYGDDDESKLQSVYRLHGRALQSIRKESALFDEETVH